MSPPKIPVEKVDADYLRRNLFYNLHTGELWWKITYGRRRADRPVGHPDAKGYLLVRILGRMFKTHRVVWCMQTANWPLRDVDHKNEIKNDNHLENLRLATTQQNGRNRGKQKNNQSGYKNVSRSGKSNRWYVRIGVKNKTHYFGSYSDPVAAAEVAKLASRKLFGTFAKP